MKEGLPDIIRTPENIKTEEAKGLREQLREKLLDVLEPVLCRFFDIKENNNDFRKLLEAGHETEQLSAEAGRFFRSLIPDGLQKPEIDDIPKHGSPNWIMMLEYNEDFKIQQEEVRKLTRKQYRDQKKEILKDSLYGRERIGFRGKVKETERDIFGVDQTVVNVHEQVGNQNLIYERISNTLNRKKKKNFAEASLVIQDIESGITLDLNALLPSDYKFVPRAMDKELFQSDAKSPITGISYKQKEVADLKDYEMGKSASGGFAVRPFYRNVDYGDLRETGGILSLLHEVAHSWQQKYRQSTEQGRAGFERLYETVMLFISKIDFLDDAERYEESEKIWKELEKEKIECLDKNGLETPINEDGVINIPNFYYNLVKLIEMIDLSDESISAQQKEELQVFLDDSKSRIRFYPIKSLVLQKTMDSYILEEREAWAHAIKTVRFLRRKGLNVEPELKCLADFLKKINPCLTSYQNRLEMDILNKKTGYRFNRVSDSVSQGS